LCLPGSPPLQWPVQHLEQRSHKTDPARSAKLMSHKTQPCKTLHTSDPVGSARTLAMQRPSSGPQTPQGF
jgi:hypothetical protein